MIDLVEKVLDNNSAVVAGKLEPLVEAGWGVTTATLAVGLGGFGEGLGF